MSKAVLVMDMPENCTECPLLNGADECIMQDEDANFNADTLDELKAGCPLRGLPEKQGNSKYQNDYEKGWNACIDMCIDMLEKTLA